jgi:hypothetical protein
MPAFEEFLAKMKDFEISVSNEAFEDKAYDDTVDLVSVAAEIGKHVDGFLTSNNLVKTKAGARVANEGLSVETLDSEIAFDDISSLVEACNIPARHHRAAMESVALCLHKAVAGSSDPGDAWATQFAMESNVDHHTSTIGLDTVFPESSLEGMDSGMPATESFGAGIDRVLPDMKVAMVVSIMRFHTGVTNRMVHTRTTSTPMIQYSKETVEVFDNADSSSPVTKLIQLYEDPSLVSTELKPIVPLADNDGSGEDSVLVQDGIIKFGKKAPLLELSIDATKPGHTRINYTDLVADSVHQGSVFITLKDGVNSDETFEVEIPSASGRLTRIANTADSADRAATIEYTGMLAKGALTTTGSASVILDGLEDGEAIKVAMSLRPTINLKSGLVDNHGSFSLSAYSPTGTPSAAADTLLGTLKSNAPALMGYKMDAKFSEENFRKSSIIARSQVQSMAYNLPTGKNYILDCAHGQELPDRRLQDLVKIIGIGQDKKNLDDITAVLDHVYNQYRVDKDALSTQYVAGGQIRPYVYQDTMDMSKVVSQYMRTSDRTGDIKQFVITYMTAVMEKIFQATFYTQQLPAGAKPTFKCVTTGYILGNVLSTPHIHNHLERGKSGGSNGVEYTLVLDNGTVIEVVTTTFKQMEGKMLFIPIIPGDPKSNLNYGHNWDNGTIVGHYTVTADRSSFKRMYANSRELIFPTCPIGAVIDVTNIETLNWITAE